MHVYTLVNETTRKGTIILVGVFLPNLNVLGLSEVRQICSVESA